MRVSANKTEDWCERCTEYKKPDAGEAGKNEANRKGGGWLMLTVEDQIRKTSDESPKYVVPSASSSLTSI